MSKPLSGRLQKIVEFLKTRGAVGATTLEIALHCQTVATSTRISELRQKGYPIDSIDKGMNAEGAHIWCYVLRSAMPAVAVQKPFTEHLQPELPKVEAQPELWKPSDQRGF